MLVLGVGSDAFLGHCLVVYHQMICHDGETFLCLKHEPHELFSCETWQKVLISLAYGIFT